MYPIFSCGLSLYPDSIPEKLRVFWEVVDVPVDIATKVNIYFDKNDTMFLGLEMLDPQGKILLKTIHD